jgi:hypothetical protein
MVDDEARDPVGESRSDFEAVVRIEFAADQAEQIISEHVGCEVDYAIVIRQHDY